VGPKHLADLRLEPSFTGNGIISWSVLNTIRCATGCKSSRCRYIGRRATPRYLQKPAMGECETLNKCYRFTIELEQHIGKGARDHDLIDWLPIGVLDCYAFDSDGRSIAGARAELLSEVTRRVAALLSTRT
jgi:hypothetical protein